MSTLLGRLEIETHGFSQALGSQGMKKTVEKWRLFQLGYMEQGENGK